ncbi:MAG TPA: DUF1848 domain-containing protein [Alphaproteobacteria bacterium]|nr:DUF1848 domain-containing protein [Alphaproteobacteria bacterium]
MAGAMIVSASYRSDIPAFYGPWFLRRLAAGYVVVRNPYGGADFRVDLRPEAVDGYIFWTRNPAPFEAALAEVAGCGTPFAVQMTITGYPRALETSVIEAPRAVAQMHAIAGTYGPRAAVWRYDPILATSLTPPAWHRRNFAALAGALAGAVDEVVVSWATIYAKTARNLAAAARAHGFDWSDPPDEEKRALLLELAEIAATHGMQMTLCSQPQLLPDAEAPHPNPLPQGQRELERALHIPSPLGGEGGAHGRRPREGEGAGGAGSALILPARCVDAGRLSDIAGRPIAAKDKGNRPGCECAESRDIGAYDTCPHGCVYCYAVQNRSRAQRRFKAHDPDDPMLGRDTPTEDKTRPDLRPAAQPDLFGTDA